MGSMAPQVVLHVVLIKLCVGSKLVIATHSSFLSLHKYEMVVVACGIMMYTGFPVMLLLSPPTR